MGSEGSSGKGFAGSRHARTVMCLKVAMCGKIAPASPKSRQSLVASETGPLRGEMKRFRQGRPPCGLTANVLGLSQPVW